MFLIVSCGVNKKESILIQGHRGSSENYPENTMLAFRKAIEEGADGIEVDIRKSSDGVFLIMHDTNLDRTTTGTGKVSERDWEYISELDAGAWKSAEFAGRDDTRVPTLDEFLLAFKKEPITLVLQIKLGQTEDIEAIVDKVVSLDMIGQCHFFGSLGAINHIKKYNPGCFTMNDGRPTSSDFEKVLRNAIEHGHNTVSVHAYEVTREMVDAVHSAGKLVHASYLAGDYEKQMRILVNMGVDIILGNNVAAMVDVKKQY